jgi:hypothetical protein
MRWRPTGRHWRMRSSKWSTSPTFYQSDVAKCRREAYGDCELQPFLLSQFSSASRFTARRKNPNMLPSRQSRLATSCGLLIYGAHQVSMAITISTMTDRASTKESHSTARPIGRRRRRRWPRCSMTQSHDAVSILARVRASCLFTARQQRGKIAGGAVATAAAPRS